jgi:hypothetical protein
MHYDDGYDVSHKQARKYIQEVKTVVKKHFPQARTIAFSGISGSSVGFPVAYLLRKESFCVRNPWESSHTSMPIGTVRPPVVFVDDFTCGGETLRRVINRVCKSRLNADFVGAIFYQGGECSSARKVLTSKSFEFIKEQLDRRPSQSIKIFKRKSKCST